MSSATRFVSVLILAVALVLPAVSVKPAEAAGTPEVTVKVNDGVPLKDGTIKVSEDGRSLILEDGTRLEVNLKNAEKIADATAGEKATYPISGSMAPSQGQSWSLYRAAGSQSTFSSTWSPSSSQVLVGIANSSGTLLWYNYYTGGCSVTATFNTSGTYYWVMINYSSNTITYSGSITY